MKTPQEWCETVKKALIDRDMSVVGMCLSLKINPYNLYETFSGMKYHLKIVKRVSDFLGIPALEKQAKRKSTIHKKSPLEEGKEWAMEDKLKPCPFCGGEAEMFISETVVTIYCAGCGIWLNVLANKSYCAKDKAIEIWSARAGGEKLLDVGEVKQGDTDGS